MSLGTRDTCLKEDNQTAMLTQCAGVQGRIQHGAGVGGRMPPGMHRGPASPLGLPGYKGFAKAHAQSFKGTTGAPINIIMHFYGLPKNG